jgi:type IV pilus assembly protein PilM
MVEPKGSVFSLWSRPLRPASQGVHMATGKSVWGIDIGQCALKAIKLQGGDGDGLHVEAFDVIEHPKILSQPDADRRQLIRNALEQFLARNSVAGCTVVIAVPGQNSFTRFVKLPPVEPKRIPDIVKFEATQQIPFPIDEVIWRWQTFIDADSPDVEVGIFAMKRSDVNNVLEHFSDVQMPVDMVQMAPLALFNFMRYDEQVSAEGATLLADVGADKTDLVVSDGGKLWTRTIQIGGNNFTEALVRSFKLSFAKAESLKRSAASHKYARQVFQAMRPVFADLVQEIQRSIGFYTSTHREARFKRLVGLGNGFRLPGLQKFLEQNLNLPVVRVDTYNKLHSEAVNTPAFAENVLSFAVAYGLALQGAGQASVDTNLLPQDIATQRRWASKRPWFVAAAAAMLVGLGIGVAVEYSSAAKLQSPENLAALDAAQKFIAAQEDLSKQFSALDARRSQSAAEAARYEKLYAYRGYWPAVEDLIGRTIRTAARDQALLEAYSVAPDDKRREAALAQLAARDRTARQYLVVEQQQADYMDDLNAIPASAGVPATPGMAPVATPTPAAGAAAPAKQPRRGFRVIITGRTPMSGSETNAVLAAMTSLARDLAKKAPFDRELELLDDMVAQITPSPAVAAPAVAPVAGAPPTLLMPDPLFPTEDMVKDTRFAIVLKLAVKEPAPAGGK